MLNGVGEILYPEICEEEHFAYSSVRRWTGDFRLVLISSQFLSSGKWLLSRYLSFSKAISTRVFVSAAALAISALKAVSRQLHGSMVLHRAVAEIHVYR